MLAVKVLTLRNLLFRLQGGVGCVTRLADLV